MTQSRQLRKDHPDQVVGHVEFKYLKTFAVQFREYTVFVCEDDKHKVSVGEPGYPVAAASRSRKAIAGKNA